MFIMNKNKMQINKCKATISQIKNEDIINYYSNMKVKTFCPDVFLI